MIRPITPADSATVIALAVESGLVPEDGTEVLHKMLADYFNGNIHEGHACLIDDEGDPLGVAYYNPAKATDRAWYLTLIAVKRDTQGRGRGTALMQHIEATLQAANQRLLLVETSGLPEFERTRNFYTRCGYEQEARVRDFYAAGEDMVLFRKVLNAA